MSVDGRMSADKIRAKQPELKDALEGGLRWTVIKAEAAKRWPELPKVIQAARQIAGQIPSIIECTVISNTKKIAAGDELLLYREKAAKAPNSKSVVVNLDSAAGPPAKKTKGSVD